MNASYSLAQGTERTSPIETNVPVYLDLGDKVRSLW